MGGKKGLNKELIKSAVFSDFENTFSSMMPAVLKVIWEKDESATWNSPQLKARQGIIDLREKKQKTQVKPG